MASYEQINVAFPPEWAEKLKKASEQTKYSKRSILIEAFSDWCQTRLPLYLKEAEHLKKEDPQ